MLLEDGTNVDNWTMDEIIDVVAEFIQYYNQITETEEDIDQQVMKG